MKWWQNLKQRIAKQRGMDNAKVYGICIVYDGHWRRILLGVGRWHWKWADFKKTGWLSE